MNTRKQTYKPAFGRKTFQKDGHWIEKPDRTPILICVCGAKYIKTRIAQTSCLRCAK